MARLLLGDNSKSGIARDVAYTLLTSTNSRGDTPISIARRRFFNVDHCDDWYLGRYVLSFVGLQVAVVPPQNHENGERHKFEACSQLNPQLSPFQHGYVLRMCNLLERLELPVDLKFQVLGFLSPLDLMNG